MNGAQDLGGMQGFGPVRQEVDEPLFHAQWERRVLALTLAMGAAGQWNIDMSRSARESLPPVQYLGGSYYEIWFAGLKKLLLNAGLATTEEMEEGRKKSTAAPTIRVLKAEHVPAVLSRGSPSERTATSPARFQVGERVRTRQINPETHTRLPRYCRDKVGCITRVHGVHSFPDTHAIGLGEQPQWLYTVEFDATELWGSDTTASSVCVDCWEPYLDPESVKHD